MWGCDKDGSKKSEYKYSKDYFKFKKYHNWTVFQSSKIKSVFFFFFCIFLFLSGYNVSYVSGGDILQLLSGILKYKNEGNRL